jgi:dTDP-4-amino-4,6-dideoxygalactose transaminase
VTSDPFLRFSTPDIGEEEIEGVVETLRSGWLTTGEKTARFERDFAAYTEAQHAQAVNSCTAGLHLALAALGIGPGDEVITTPLTFCATVNVILAVGAKPVLADIGADLNISPEAISAVLNPRTRAIIPVHFGGLPCDMESIWALARRAKLFVIEDAAHAAGAQYAGRPIGSGTSDAVAFSFYATKNLSTGEGGMVTTPSAELADRMRILCLHGISRDAWARYSEKGSWYYEVTACGFKCNMSDVMAAIGLGQLEKLEKMTARRIEIAHRYNDAFADTRQVQLPPDSLLSRHCWHLFVLRLNLDQLTIDRGQFFDEMGDRGIGCSVHFIPIPKHPLYREILSFPDPCTRALEEYPRLLSIPLYSRMSDAEIDRVILAVRDVCMRFSKTKQFAVSMSSRPALQTL